MRKWVVTLPGHRHYTLESDTPAETLTEMGYSAFALMELDGPAMRLWRKYPPVPGQKRQSHQFGGRKEITHGVLRASEQAPYMGE